ncbi:MAG: hydroxyacid dehydrogenase [Granulosicoccus sp.]
MPCSAKPRVLAAPHPRTIDLLFSEPRKHILFDKYDVLEVEADDIEKLPEDILKDVRYVLGQPALAMQSLKKMQQLKCIFNVEGNLINNMPYEYLFETGIHVVTTSAVFAEPVAEIGLALALCLARNVVDADLDFRNGNELWGGDSNTHARMISGSKTGIIGFGDLGRSLARVLSGFRTDISVYDPWLPPSMLEEQGVRPTPLNELLSTSDFVFVVASVTSENEGFLNADAFARMKQGSAFILLSRADVVNFDDLLASVSSGHILAATDVFPDEPVAQNHPVRSLKGFIRSAHRAGALESVFRKMGDMVLEDMALLDNGLPPMRCKRAERETVSRMRSKPVTKN